MINLKQYLLKLKLSILESLEESVKEKSTIEMVMLRRHEPPKVENAFLLVAKRKIKK